MKPKIYAVPVTIYTTATDPETAYRFTGLDLVHLTEVLRRGFVTNELACIALGDAAQVHEVTLAEIAAVQAWEPPEEWYARLSANTVRHGGKS